MCLQMSVAIAGRRVNNSTLTSASNKRTSWMYADSRDALITAQFGKLYGKEHDCGFALTVGNGGSIIQRSWQTKMFA